MTQSSYSSKVAEISDISSKLEDLRLERARILQEESILLTRLTQISSPSKPTASAKIVPSASIIAPRILTDSHRETLVNEDSGIDFFDKHNNKIDIGDIVEFLSPTISSGKVGTVLYFTAHKVTSLKTDGTKISKYSHKLVVKTKYYDHDHHSNEN